jgi:hypothetical protein
MVGERERRGKEKVANEKISNTNIPRRVADEAQTSPVVILTDLKSHGSRNIREAYHGSRKVG